LRRKFIKIIPIGASFISVKNLSDFSLHVIFQSQQNGTEIDVATRLWINPALAASNNYMTALKTYYGTDIQQLNFENTNNAANIINSWVRENTRNNIKTIIQPGI